LPCQLVDFTHALTLLLSHTDKLGEIGLLLKVALTALGFFLLALSFAI
jgi:hypothetical protein